MIKFYCGSQRPQLQYTLYIDFRKTKVLQRDNKNTLKKYAKDINPLDPIAEKISLPLYSQYISYVMKFAQLSSYKNNVLLKFHATGCLSHVLDIPVIQVPLHTLKMVFSVSSHFLTIKTTRFIQNPFIFALRTPFWSSHAFTYLNFRESR